jgi:hypothetical protein
MVCRSICAFRLAEKKFWAYCNLAGHTLAMATMEKDFANLQAEASLEAAIGKLAGPDIPDIRKTA